MARTKRKPLGPIPDKIMRDAIMLELATTEEVRMQDGSVKTFRKARLLAMALVNGAIKGDAALAKIVVDRSDGKLPTVIAGDPAAPIVQEVTHQEAPAAAPAVNYDDLSTDDLVRLHAARAATGRQGTTH